jgi:hypothetical protein
MSNDPADQPSWPPCLNRTDGKIAGFWVITQKPLIKAEIGHTF